MSEHSTLAKQLDARLCSVELSPEIRSRAWDRLRRAQRRPRPRVRPSVLVGAGALATVVALASFGLLGRDAPTPSPANATPQPVAIAPAAPHAPPQALASEPPKSCVSRDGLGATRLDGACSLQLQDPPLTIASTETSTLRTTGRTIALDRGWVVFDVEPVGDADPVRIEVSSGTIVVLGTRFSVYQDDVRGHVELVEGRIRFEGADGTHTILEPGERMAWERERPMPTESAPASRRPPAPKRPPVRRAPTADDPRPPLDEIARLRAKGRYRAALNLIDELSTRSDDQRTKEVLHYEAGTILEDGLRDESTACAHWAEHGRRYPDGRYQREVQRRLRGCQR